MKWSSLNIICCANFQNLRICHCNTEGTKSAIKFQRINLSLVETFGIAEKSKFKNASQLPLEIRTKFTENIHLLQKRKGRYIMYYFTVLLIMIIAIRENGI